MVLQVKTVSTVLRQPLLSKLPTWALPSLSASSSHSCHLLSSMVSGEEEIKILEEIRQHSEHELNEVKLAKNLKKGL